MATTLTFLALVGGKLLAGPWVPADRWPMPNGGIGPSGAPVPEYVPPRCTIELRHPWAGVMVSRLYRAAVAQCQAVRLA